MMYNGCQLEVEGKNDGFKRHSSNECLKGNDPTITEVGHILQTFKLILSIRVVSMRASFILVHCSTNLEMFGRRKAEYFWLDASRHLIAH